MPKWNARKPYGYTCFARLFGKAKAEQYVPVEGWVRVIRFWDNHLDNMSPEGIKSLSGKAMINFSHPAAKKLVGVTDHAIQYDDGWYVPKSDMKRLVTMAYKKHLIDSDELQTLLK
jgi:hypothetical protein